MGSEMCIRDRSMTESLLTDNVKYSRMAKASNPYGDGKASDRIIDALSGTTLAIQSKSNIR